MDTALLTYLKKEIGGKEFHLSKWQPPEDSPAWSHDHCVICKAEISALHDSENEAYCDGKGFDWVCKACFKKYAGLLDLKEEKRE